MTASRNRLPIAFVLLLLVFTGSAPAAVYSTNSSLDALVTTGPAGSQSVSNYGGGGALGVAAAGLPQGEFRSALQFNTAGAVSAFNTQFGAGWDVQSISLQLTATPPNNALYNATSAGQFQIYWMPNDSWLEGTGTPATPSATGITFNSLQGIISGSDESLGTFSFGGATNGSVNYTLNLTSGFKADVMAGNNVSLRIEAADSSVSYLFNSRNFGTASSRPLFSIVAVPEPTTLALGALCGFGLTLLAARRRRP